MTKNEWERLRVQRFNELVFETREEGGHAHPGQGVTIEAHRITQLIKILDRELPRKMAKGKWVPEPVEPEEPVDVLADDYPWWEDWT